MIKTMLRLIDELKSGAAMPAKAVCAAVNLPYPSYCRWLVRSRLSQPLLQAAGPKKVAPFDANELQQDIRMLGHRRSLSYGTPMIYEKYMSCLSQRAIAGLIRQARLEHNREIRESFTRIEWLVPNLVWAMDDCEISHENIVGAGMACFQQFVEPASRYHFTPVGGEAQPCGEEIAGHLAQMSEQNDPPLFLKRDNGSNQNHSKVNEFIAAHMIIPINSPVAYPPYNGAVEKAQNELQECLRQRLSLTKYHISMMESLAENSVHELNHRSRPCLKGRNSCQVFFDCRRRVKFTKRERRAIYEWLRNAENDILFFMEKDDCKYQKGTAWRLAVQVWLQMKGYIVIKLNGKVSPNFFAENYHN